MTSTDISFPRLPERAPPTRASTLLFEAKMWAHRAIHGVTATRPARLAKGADADFPAIAALSRTRLWGDPRPGEQAAQSGKVQNLRLAARAFDGLIIGAGETFSFWRQLGRASRRRGFVAGRMLKEGCMVSAVGGGLCQLSNALYAVALDAGCEIVERHGHSRVVPGSAATAGRDATIAWNYVDLRFRAREPLMLCVRLTRDMLEVELRAPRDVAFVPRETESEMALGRSCGTCDQTNCFRHEHDTGTRRAAFLMDEAWPEFRAYAARADARDSVLSPQQVPVARMLRSLGQRRAKTAPQRRAAELAGNACVARALARRLTPDVTDVTVAQSLLPALWQGGHLGGRRFTVLMTRLPMAEIQSRLDAAAKAHPERLSLSDFRADPALLATEAEALAAADRIVTPHAEIARLYGDRAVLLDWAKPKPMPRGTIVPNRIAFPGPTIARKGAYELRDGARTLDLEVVLVGSELEGPDFWSGVRTIRAGGDNWLDGVACVVQPALLEDAPRKLLQALASGVPVIATRACGLAGQDGVTLIEHADELVSALTSIT